MPLYEYRCTKCGHRFEKIQSFSSTPESECPKCHGALERPLTAPAFQFKGAGWYVNDYSSKPSSSASSDDAPKAAPAADSKAADSKPAASESASTPAAAAESSAKANTSSTSTT